MFAATLHVYSVAAMAMRQNADAHTVNDSDDDDVLILTPCGSGIDVWISARNRSINDEDDAGST